MYEMLKRLAVRPAPHSSMTIGALWTRPHIARQMLAFHLDSTTHFASRPRAEIETIVAWLDERLGFEGRRVCDLGCGPGLYATRVAERGAEVTGVDFSTVAIAHARSQAAGSEGSPQYLVADYLKDELPGGFDLVTLIYFDYCALSPVDRHVLLLKIRSMLNPGGSLVMDVLAETAFDDVSEQLTLEERLMNGFWSDTDYVGVHRTWLYREEKLSLDHYLIVEPSGHWEILNWMQYFTAERIVRELEEAGFAIRSLTGSLAGDPLVDASGEIGVIADGGAD